MSKKIAEYNNGNMQRFDLIFSLWIDLWYILYEFVHLRKYFPILHPTVVAIKDYTKKLIHKEVLAKASEMNPGWLPNPKPMVKIMLLVNTFLLSTMVYFRNDAWMIGMFFIMQILFKVWMLWRLRKTAYQWADFAFGIALFVLYCLWVLVNGSNIYELFQQYINNIRQNIPNYHLNNIQKHQEQVSKFFAQKTVPPDDVEHFKTILHP